MLPVLTFKPIYKSVLWGGSRIAQFKHEKTDQENIGESWELSPVPGHESVVDEGKFAGKTLCELTKEFGAELVGKRTIENFGGQFPLLIKFIDSCQDLSVQVHPDNELARVKHNSPGKTEMWYAVAPTPDAYLYDGFNRVMDKSLFMKAVEDKTIIDCLAKHNVRKGDVFYLPAGRVHAIGAGNFVLEIQQASDVTYRIYDYDRRNLHGNLRELHIKDALDAIKFDDEIPEAVNVQPKTDDMQTLVDCPFFKTSLLGVDGDFELKLEKDMSFTIIINTDGNVTVTAPDGATTELPQGRTALIPASMPSIRLSGKGNVVLVNI